MVKVLIIEDEVELLDNLKSYLESFEGEFHVLTASSGEAGLSCLEDNSDVDILVTDVRLPGIDGIEIIGNVVQRWPGVRIVVMTAFGSPSLRETASREGALKFIEKPVDLDGLPDLLSRLVEKPSRSSRAVAGLDILDVAEFFSVAGETKVVCFGNGNGKGVLVFENGGLVHCATERFEGTDAFFDMALWGEGVFHELLDVETRHYSRNVDAPISHLLEEAFRLLTDVPEQQSECGGEPVEFEARTEASPPGISTAAGVPPGESANTTQEEKKMADIKELLQPIADVNGFQGVGVFTEGGEMIESIVTGKIDAHTVGIYTNNVLLNAQKATDEMGVGRGSLVTINAPKATLLVRCYNEATDFSSSAEGKAHFHTVVILEADGNLGMAKLMLEKVVQGIAEVLR